MRTKNNSILDPTVSSYIPKDANGKPTLSKRWFIQIKAYNPKTNKFHRLKKYEGINSFTSIKDRQKAINEVFTTYQNLVNEGWSPFDQSNPIILDNPNIADLAQKVLNYKKSRIKRTNYKNLVSRYNIFIDFIFDTHGQYIDAEKITKQTIQEFVEYLFTREISTRTINNYLVDISGLFSAAIKLDILSKNPCFGIDKLETESKTHQLYSDREIEVVEEYLKRKQYQLYVFIKIFQYLFIRPVTMVRLQVKDIDTDKWQIDISPKNEKTKRRKVKRIIELAKPFFVEMKLEQYPPDYYVFTARGIDEVPSTRDYYSKQFLKHKRAMKLSDKFTMYGFRHYMATKLYHKLKETLPEDIAVTKLMEITGHESRKALFNYLKNIGAIVPDDYSNLIE